MAILKAESYKRGIIKSTFFNFAAKALGFVNSLLVIYLFGSNFRTDLYFLILATVTLFTTFVNGVDLLILIPESMRIRINKGEKQEMAFLNFFVLSYAIIGLLIALFILVSPTIFYTLFSKYTSQSLEQEKFMLLISSILIPFQLLNNLFISILTSYRYFTVPMATNIVNSFLSIAVLLLLNKWFSITSAVIALAIGYVINFIWLTFILKKNLDWVFLKNIKIPSGKVISNILLAQLNILPISFKSYITFFLLSGLGVGIITAFNYGQQLYLIPEMLIVAQIVAVAGIKFNELSSSGEEEELNLFFFNTMNLLLVITLPMALLMALFSEDMATILFKYFKKVNSSAIDNISMVIFFLAFTIPGRALDIVMTKISTAQQKIRLGVAYGVVIHTLLAVLVTIGTLSFGLKGYLMAVLLGQAILLPVIYYYLIKKIAPFIQYVKWFINSIPFTLFNIVMAALFFWVKNTLLNGFPEIVNIAMLGTLYLAGVILFNYHFKFYVPLNTVIRKVFFKRQFV